MSARGLFLLALGWTGVIYSTLYVARPVAEFLRDRNLLRLTVWTVVALVGGAVLVWVVRRRPGLRGWGAILFGAVAFLFAISSVSPAEVRLHFVEYGVLGGLFYLAFQARGARLASLWAIAATGAAGWLDEGIQYLLPNRWYDLQDVVINLVAGALTVVTMVFFGTDRAGRSVAAGPRPEPPPDS